MLEPADHHPLFPAREDDTEPPEIHTIRVIRWEHGRQRYSPHEFGPEDLRSLGDIYELFGGGDYEIEARDRANHFARKERYSIDGRPKPLTGEAAAEAQPTPVAPAHVAAAGGGGMSESMMALLVAMMNNQHAASMKQMEQQTAILTAVLTRGDQNNQAYAQNLTAMQTAMLEAVSRAQNGGGAEQVMSAFLKGCETVQDLREGIAEGQSEASEDNQTMQTLLQGLQMFVQQQGMVGAPGGAMPPVEPPRQTTPTNGAGGTQTTG